MLIVEFLCHDFLLETEKSPEPKLRGTFYDPIIDRVAYIATWR